MEEVSLNVHVTEKCRGVFLSNAPGIDADQRLRDVDAVIVVAAGDAVGVGSVAAKKTPTINVGVFSGAPPRGRRCRRA
jgi:hypothetical protein